MTSATLDKSARTWGPFERVVLVGVLAVLGLQYYVYDTLNRIIQMPTVVVTIPGKLPNQPAALYQKS